MGREEPVVREEGGSEEGVLWGRGGYRKRGGSRGETGEWGMLEVHWNWTAPYSSQLILTSPPISHMQTHNEIDRV